MRVASPPIEKVEGRIVSTGDPHGAPAMFHGFLTGPRRRRRSTRIGNATPTPDGIARVWIQSLEEMRDVGRVARGAHNHATFDDQRSNAQVVAESHVGDGFVPQL